MTKNGICKCKMSSVVNDVTTLACVPCAYFFDLAAINNVCLSDYLKICFWCSKWHSRLVPIVSVDGKRRLIRVARAKKLPLRKTLSF